MPGWGVCRSFRDPFITWEERKKAGSLELERWAAQETTFPLLSLPPLGEESGFSAASPAEQLPPHPVSVKEL